MNHLLPCLLLWTTAIFAAEPTDWTLHSATTVESFRLAEARGKYVALHFLLKTECPLCLRHTRDHLSQAATLPNVVQVMVKPDSDREIEAWAAKGSPEERAKQPIYRDPHAKLAKAYGIPDGYAFHGQVVHYPALILIGPDGREVFRYVGKTNSDRFSFEKLAAKVAELSKTSHN